MQVSPEELAALVRGTNDSPAQQNDSPAQQHEFGSTWKIVVCQRGWIFVGKVVRQGEYLVSRDTQNIRRWGTKRGLGQLASEGPHPETTLDPYGTVRVHELAVVNLIDCDDARWANAVA